MADATDRDDRTPHILIVLYPAQGHINPMLQFSKRLQKRGLKISLVTTNFIARTSHSIPSSFPLLTISDGYDDGGFASAESAQIYLDSLRQFGSESLREVLLRLSTSASPADCVVYDSFLSWALDIANEFEISTAVFFTQSCAVADIYYHVYKGLIELPLPDRAIEIPGLPPLQPPEFPSFIHQLGTYPAYYDLLVNQYANVDKADWIFCNTFYELEREVLECLKRIWPAIRAVGPSIPSGFLDGRIEDDRDYGFSLFNPDGDVSLKWLDGRRKGSVVYVSFGSLGKVPAEQMEEMAGCLKSSDWQFLWVVRTSDVEKLPKNFMAETRERGLVVRWCQQLEVLAHEAVGCFVTHCGWNSTLEGVSLGVPMVAVPGWTDQATNAKFITDVWKVGLKAPTNDNGVVNREALLQCIEEVMVGDKSNEIRQNAGIWKVLAQQVFEAGGSFDGVVHEFLTKRVSLF
ncbi:flavonol 7-O-beta-glucosyltransferase UGT74F1-like [Benincasa hispida]|uniref:flavonol 7-O-beta-glucosyltransferase UGT74F1-like n=1 Tax=Benincasa hispida TaxID=102211 RepID=UPI001901BCE2|nr:flavonol 7-O-beta-glucosyltransferase UGT74F1-like [Benincasa hispida]